MFSEKINDLVKKSEELGKSNKIKERELLNLLEKCSTGESLEIEEIFQLINATFDEKNREMIIDFSINYRRPRDKEILLLPPLYFSNICENNCLYCNFSSKGIRLSYEEFLEELNTLLDMGYRSIELVSSQDPELYIHEKGFNLENQIFNIEKVIRYFEITHERLKEAGGGMITSNIPPVDYKSFQKLKSAGLDCYLIWLETLNPAQYSKLHYKKGPKSNQAFRIDSLETAIQAGINHVAGAFLKGLYDWRKEEIILYMFDKYLKEKYGKGFSIIGTPRLKGKFTKSKLVKKYQVPDSEYELNIALDRILFDGILWLQTRESFSLNRYLINKFGGGVILTLTSCTSPGGYYKPPKSHSQFPVYKQDLKESVSILKDDGFTVHFSWDSNTLYTFLRNKSNYQIK